MWELFLDRVELFLKSGDGGNGAKSFRHEKYVAQGGPDGGDGGRGGHVILRVAEGLTTLSAYRFNHHFRAGTGGGGQGGNRHGSDGEDVILDVPPGTVVIDKDQGRVLYDLTRPGESVIVARGGRGGRGNTHFKSPVERRPRFAERGEPGKEVALRLELRLIADVGLVGLPNAGKSSLLTRMTRARPKIGNYPFTTLSPELGVVEEGEIAFTVADLPGLIEGAHEGKGLGHEFLRHIERCRLLVHVVDAGTQTATEALAAVHQVEAEMRAYRPDLVERASLYFLNKTDLPGGARTAGELVRLLSLSEGDVLQGSAATGEGVRLLILRAAERLASLPPAPPVRVEGPEWVDPGAFTVAREGAGFRVTGLTVERRVAMSDLDNPEASRRLGSYLRRKGVEGALREAGAREGDEVVIGDARLELHFDEEEAVEGNTRDEDE